MADSKPSPLDSQLYSQSWTTIEDMRDRVSRHSDILNRLVLTMGRQEDLLERLAALAEQHTQMLAALARLVPAPRSTPPHLLSKPWLSSQKPWPTCSASPTSTCALRTCPWLSRGSSRALELLLAPKTMRMTAGVACAGAGDGSPDPCCHSVARPR